MIESDVQKPDPGELVTLFELDARPLGGEVYYFTQAQFESQAVTWRGNEYTPVSVVADGFEISGQGTLPRPKLSVSNVTYALSSAVRSWGDIIGAVVTRWRTFRKYLDGQPNANPDSHLPPDVFIVERKSEQTKTHITWELSAMMDQEGRKLPRRQVLRDTCTAIYRRWTGAAFNYVMATCPYTGTSCFDRDGNATTEAADICGKKTDDCKLRFPAGPLPTHAFPAVSRTRVR